MNTRKASILFHFILKQFFRSSLARPGNLMEELSVSQSGIFSKSQITDSLTVAEIQKRECEVQAAANGFRKKACVQSNWKGLRHTRMFGSVDKGKFMLFYL